MPGKLFQPIETRGIDLALQARMDFTGYSQEPQEASHFCDSAHGFTDFSHEPLKMAAIGTSRYLWGFRELQIGQRLGRSTKMIVKGGWGKSPDLSQIPNKPPGEGRWRWKPGWGLTGEAPAISGIVP